MAPIDLVLYAEHSRKLPRKLTAPIARKKVETGWKLLLSHVLDFWAIAGTAAVMGLMFNNSFKFFMVTKNLNAVYSEEGTVGLSFLLIPFIAFNYFFFSYFLNHGQTWGMHLVKKRISMPAMSFKECAKWASHSMLLTHSLGLSIYFKKAHWDFYKDHDHLYTELISYKESKVIDLLNEIDNFEDQVPEFEYQEAA